MVTYTPGIIIPLEWRGIHAKPSTTVHAVLCILLALSVCQIGQGNRQNDDTKPVDILPSAAFAVSERANHVCRAYIAPSNGGMRLCEWVEGERVTQFCCSHRVERSEVSTTESASICVASAGAEMPEKDSKNNPRGYPEIGLYTHGYSPGPYHKYFEDHS